jgi:hypothetical protein
MDDGETGITVAACGSCNSSLSGLESDVADLSRTRRERLTQPESFIVKLWAIKTIWVLGKSLSIDPLHGFGEGIVRDLTGTSDVTSVPQVGIIDDALVTVEPASTLRVLTYLDGQSEQSWVTLQMRNLVTSIWLTPHSQ